ncbi:GNAT family N-acetyltransferase [Enterococcus termitis]|uniref:GNAT family N-acetyltransferase n=1 Tax=Enterococcus termitis TaxID=332950 RepID=A0A1E5H716_9ENTE|nr:GNAT family N-acetyltransferase [Enterococcus termitis]OEG20692.1 GNAT family N-acetyltransferase [Enterococcus termitis]OJG99735.1 hypothetical protein RV18_GL000074 [Enterococcus termitis]
MIKKIERPTTKELETILTIWLSANIEAHPFIPKSYWLDNFEFVKAHLPQAALYVSIEANEIVGFLGMTNNYIAGIFILSAYRNQKIGQALLNEVKQTHDHLRLSVYKKNQAAVAFYLKQDFQLINEQVDATGEVEYELIWKR